MIKIKALREKITPPVGTHLAGYGVNVISDGIHDDLFVSGISFDDGKSRAILLSYDLLGLDADLIQKIKKECSSIVGIQPENIVLTCTHTHSGPHTRSLAIRLRDAEYSSKLIEYSKKAVSNAFDSMRDVSVYHYSIDCHENVNRRVITPDNTCHFLPCSKHLMPLANGITDPELGIVFFVNESEKPIATLLNYAAHPLTCQSGGASSLKISSDYPGVLRKIVEQEIGGACIFTTGACGDLHPKGFETGFERTEEMGRNMAIKVIDSFSDSLRNQQLYKLNDNQLEVRSGMVELAFRKSGCVEERLPLYKDMDKETFEFQILRLGDICFVGVPGELLVEPGLEIKWNSPFRKTFILYNSTAYVSYIPPTNAYVSGGYESSTAHIEPFASFKLVSRIVEEFEKSH
jgi:neutral ceramidase